MILLILIFLNLVFLNSLNCQLEKPEHKIKVIVKLIEVYPIDNKGNPLTDLSKDDFEIYLDKKRMPIEYFERKDLSLEEKKYFMKDIRKKWIFFIDFAHNSVKGIRHAKISLLQFLEKTLKDEDLVSVISYSKYKELKIHTFFSNDKIRISKIIKELGLKEIIGDVEEFGSFWKEEEEEKKEKKMKELKEAEKRIEIRQFSEALRRFAIALRYIEGVKHLILFSNGLPSSFMYGKPSWRDSYQWGDSTIREVYESMAKEFSNSNTLIYSINTEGIPDSFSLSSWFAEQGEHSLARLAQLTGGKYYPPREDLKSVIDDISKSTSFYYVLGFPVEEEMDGKFHKIEVKVKRKGAKVHAPTGYYNPKPFKEYTKYEKFIHLVDVALSERPLMQEVKEIPIEVIPISESMIELKFEIPINEIMPEGVGEIEVAIIFFNGERKIVKLNSKRLSFSSKKEKVLYKEALELSGGAEELRVVIRNLQNGRAVRGVKRTK